MFYEIISKKELRYIIFMMLLFEVSLKKIRNIM